MRDVSMACDYRRVSAVMLILYVVSKVSGGCERLWSAFPEARLMTSRAVSTIGAVIPNYTYGRAQNKSNDSGTMEKQTDVSMR